MIGQLGGGPLELFHVATAAPHVDNLGHACEIAFVCNSFYEFKVGFHHQVADVEKTPAPKIEYIGIVCNLLLNEVVGGFLVRALVCRNENRIKVKCDGPIPNNNCVVLVALPSLATDMFHLFF